jgi:hypothetical protein
MGHLIELAKSTPGQKKTSAGAQAGSAVTRLLPAED